MGISDKIEAFILELFKQENESLKIQRNELADVFGCVPSQINYVISTRFCPERGYMVTSRRGGGGYVVIKKLNNNNNEIADKISESDAYLFINNLYENGSITLKEAKIIKSAVSDMSLFRIKDKNVVRADILKNILRIKEEEV